MRVRRARPLSFARTRAPRTASPAVAALVLVGGALALALGCTRAPPAEEFRVALLSPGPISDGGWNAAAYEGLLAIRDRLGAEVSQVETRTPPEFEEAFRDYARRGFALVIGHGFEFQDAAARVAPEFPGTVFLTTSGSTVRPNVGAIVFRLEEATFVLGDLAARMAPDGAACAVGGMEIPSVRSTLLAYEAGARHARPGYPVTIAYIGSWDDVGAARATTLALIDRGCRFVLHNADAAGAGVLQAASERGVHAFGSNQAQHALAPTAVLASAVLDVPSAFLDVAGEVKARTFEGRVIERTMADGAIAVVYNPALADAIPVAVRAAVDATAAAIRAGSLAVPTAGF